MTEYAAGTVAVATVRGVPNVRVMRTNGTRGGDTLWFSAVHVAGWRSHMSRNVTDVRPLVVLDLDGLVEPQTLANFMRATGLCGSRTIGDALADQIEAQTKPPRIPEPGLYGVVEATVDGADRRRFCHLEDDGEGWSGAGAWFYWRDLTDPKLIRPGIEDES